MRAAGRSPLANSSCARLTRAATSLGLSWIGSAPACGVASAAAACGGVAMACGCGGVGATGAGGAAATGGRGVAAVLVAAAIAVLSDCRDAQVSRTKVVTRVAPSAVYNSAGKFISPTKSVGGMIAVCEISCAGTRHSFAPTRLPAVSRTPAGIDLIMTVMPGAGASTLTPSSSGSLIYPLLLRTINVGASLGGDAGNKDGLKRCHTVWADNALSSTGACDVGNATA